MADRMARAVHDRLGALFPGKVAVVSELPAPPETELRVIRPRSAGAALEPSQFNVHVRVLFWGFQTKLTAQNEDLIKTAESANPPLALLLNVQVLALAEPGDEFSGGVSVRYESVPRRLAAWARDDARALREELAVAEREITREIVARITGRPPGAASD